MRYYLLASLPTVAYGTSCINHPASDGFVVDGPVKLFEDPLRNFDSVMIPVYNNSAIEDWSHDAVSADGSSGMALTSSRGSIGGSPGAQRIFISVVWPNGTRYMENAFFEESNIESCPDITVGRWFNTTHDVEWEFEYTTDFKRTLVTVNTPTISGTVEIHSLVPPLYPNGLEYPHARGNTLFAPLLYWVENVPTGVVDANLTILGTPFVLHGIGGRERNWLPLSWGATSASWDMMRGVVGPYRFIAWNHRSKLEGGSQFSMVLLKGEEVVFRTERLDSSSSETWGSITQITSGPVHLASPADEDVKLPESTFTGYVIKMVSPRTGEQWEFEIDFTRTVYWFPASPPAYLGGFGAKVVGGLVGGCQYEGESSGNAQELIL